MTGLLTRIGRGVNRRTRLTLSALAYGVRGTPVPWTRRRGAPVYIGDHTAMTETWRGDIIFVDTNDPGITPHIIRSGTWEPWIEKRFFDLIRPGMSVVDVGAHCGYYALGACRAAGPSGHVTIIEANPAMCIRLRKSILANGYEHRSTLIHGAALDEHRSVQFHIPRDGSGYSSINAFEEERPSDTLTVQGVTLDELIADKPVNVIKIDAEGAEPLIWAGARKVVEKNRPLSIFMEMMPLNVSHSRDPRDFLEEIVASGFSIGEIEVNAVKPIGIDEILGKPWSELLLTR